MDDTRRTNLNSPTMTLPKCGGYSKTSSCLITRSGQRRLIQTEPDKKSSRSGSCPANICQAGALLPAYHQASRRGLAGGRVLSGQSCLEQGCDRSTFEIETMQCEVAQTTSTKPAHIRGDSTGCQRTSKFWYLPMISCVAAFAARRSCPAKCRAYRVPRTRCDCDA
jgi:hypothetical protein